MNEWTDEYATSSDITNTTYKIRNKVHVIAVIANINKITGKKIPAKNRIGLTTNHWGLVPRL